MENGQFCTHHKAGQQLPEAAEALTGRRRQSSSSKRATWMLTRLKENERLFLLHRPAGVGCRCRYAIDFCRGYNSGSVYPPSQQDIVKVYEEGCDQIRLTKRQSDKATHLEDVFVVDTRNSTAWDQRMCGRINWVRNVVRQSGGRKARTREVT